MGEVPRRSTALVSFAVTMCIVSRGTGVVREGGVRVAVWVYGAWLGTRLGPTVLHGRPTQ
jgi:hypothetical protein